VTHRRRRGPYAGPMAEIPTCARHPDVETRLRCSSCETPICPDCGREAAVGFKCPDCAAHAEGTVTRRDGGGGGLFGRLGGASGARQAPGTGSRGGDEPADPPDRDGERAGSGPSRPRWMSSAGRGSPGAGDGAGLPTATGVRATVVGLAAAFLGGLVLGPVLQGGPLFLISSGVIGWGVARSVYWATEERNSPYVRAIALTLAGFTVAIGMGVASGIDGGRAGEIAFLAYPAALYGGWIVVRQR
jgi:predicted RNA-binding Zn-ribbon protein involved in translation (DUF1610 family)